MQRQYFDRFPIIEHSNNNVRDIFARVILDEETKQTPENFTNVTLPDQVSMRGDIIADTYYDSPYLDWLFYIGNDIIDPYSGYLDSQLFYDMIVSKYGDVILPQQKIIFYINNWSDNPDDILTVEQYNSATKAVKKYYTANIDYSNRILNYVRHKKDWKKATNKVRVLTVDSTDSFVIGDLVTQYVSGNQIASGEITDIDTENLTVSVKNITGDFVITGGNVLYRYNSTVEYTVSATENPHTEDNITAEELRFWSPMTYFNYELETNEAKRNVKIARSQGITKIYSNLDKLFEE
jgi:hypothetical protein